MISLSDLPEPLVRYIVGMWRQRWLIAALTWAVALLGWFFLLMAPDVYTSRAQVYLNTDTFLRSFIDKTATSADFEKRVRVMRLQLLSRENMEIVAKSSGLAAELTNETELSRVVQDLQNDISVVNEEGQYFYIDYGNHDAVIAQRVVDQVVNLFIEQDIGAGIVQSRQAVGKVEQEINNLEQQLAEKDEEISEFRRQHAAELAGDDRTLRQLDLLESELTRIDDARYRAIRNRDELRRLLAATPRTTSKGELDTLKIQLAQLESQYLDNHPDIIGLRAKIAELQAGGAGLPDNPEYLRLETTLRSVEGEVQELAQRKSRIEQDIERYTLLSGQVPAVQAELQEMMRSYTQVENLYKELLGQQSSLAITANLSEGGGTIEYKIFEAPVVAAEPSSPPRGILTFLILFAAAGLAGGIAFLITHFDTSYTMANQMQEALGLPVLGAVSPVLTPRYRTVKLFERVSLGMICAALGAATIALFWYQIIYVPEGPSAQSVAADSTDIYLQEGI
ncbi:XrtA system polysaccharide chain length determinant [Parvularcula sp. IMCC14364]|uniref:XrtA system polysaccharide chain length determinant n=1 Tax=Parvularcula sp. IMCC14364 TaxID=3067902 RepID=UPI0027413EBC|nr:XrtA system polysaccharide chain length determinant [Parvularcula sp. IMCC14364]